LVWASRRQGDAVLRFIAVQEEARRQGIGRALLGALARALAGRPAAGAPDAAPAYLPLRAQLNEAGPEQAFFRRAGFEAERVTLNMAREL
jgi:ribosomal protein S18 acetylase RimI-like enzyme